MKTIAVYFFQVGDNVQIGPTRNLRQYYHKMKRDNRWTPGYKFLGYIPADDYATAGEITKKNWWRLRERHVQGKIYHIYPRELRLVVFELGDKLTFSIPGT